MTGIYKRIEREIWIQRYRDRDRYTGTKARPRQRLEWWVYKPRNAKSLAGKHQEHRGLEQTLPQSLQKGLTKLTPEFQMSSFQKCMRIHFCCFKPSKFGISLQQS